MRMQGLFRRLRRDSRGNALAEMALVAPALILLMTAVVEVGGAIEQTVRLENAARAGAVHAAALPSDTAGIESTVRAALEGWSDVTVSGGAMTCECPGSGPVSCGGTCATAMQRFVNVTVTRPFSGVILSGRTTLTGHVVQRVQ
jgi:Flp pilus assembly protein TadG